MPRKRHGVTDTDVRRWIRQGLGQGTKEGFRPWVGVRDVPTRGRAYRPHGLRVDRAYHLLSRAELGHFLKAELNPAVTDIREQYALLPVEATLAIAQRLGIRYPTYPGTRTPWVLTTDLLVSLTAPQGEECSLALCVKPRAELQPGAPRIERTIQKLAIERAYWGERGVDWRLVTDQEVPAQFRYNLIRLRPTQMEWRSPWAWQQAHEVASAVRAQRDLPTLGHVIQACVRDLGYSREAVHRLLGLAVWTHALHVDLARPLAWHRPLHLAED